VVDAKLDGSVGGIHRGSTYRRIEVITGEARRRRWTAAEKAAILAESFEPGAQLSDVARRHGMNRNLLGTWRRQARRSIEARPTFVPLQVRDEVAGSARAPAKEPNIEPGLASRLEVGANGPQIGTIEIETNGVRVRISGAADLPALRQILAYLGRRP
jgi:transposase